MGHAVLVIGASRYLGAALVRVLTDEPGVDRVVAVDASEPRHPLGDAEFVRTLPGDPVVARLLATERIDTVVHSGLVSASDDVGGRTAMKELNVIGTMQLLAACQRSPVLRRVVLRSATAVYGASPRDPALFTEDDQPRGGLRGGYSRDVVEAEGYVRGLARRRPDVAVTVLRFADVLGPAVDSPFSRYFTLPVLPAVLGFDPRLQFLHADDGVEVLRRAVVSHRPGTFNVAGGGIVKLSQAARRLGLPVAPLPRPAVPLVASGARRAGQFDLTSDQLALLTYGRGVDTTKLHGAYGYVPAWTTAETLADFARAREVRGPLAPGRVAAVEGWLLRALDKLGGHPSHESPARDERPTREGSAPGTAPDPPGPQEPEGRSGDLRGSRG